MPCHYLDSVLAQAGGSRTADLERHLLECAGCRHAAGIIADLDKALRSLGTPAAPAGFDARLRGRIEQLDQEASPSLISTLFPLLDYCGYAVLMAAVCWTARHSGFHQAQLLPAAGGAAVFWSRFTGRKTT